MKTKKSKKKEKKIRITKKMYFYQVLSQYPETVDVFLKYNMHCVGCSVGRYETIEQGALAHGLDPDKLVKELNEKLKKK
ncbi:MAG: DUF1858 domain-containing protein [Candidatus Pacearchaeota archaeon]